MTEMCLLCDSWKRKIKNNFLRSRFLKFSRGYLKALRVFLACLRAFVFQTSIRVLFESSSEQIYKFSFNGKWKLFSFRKALKFSVLPKSNSPPTVPKNQWESNNHDDPLYYLKISSFTQLFVDLPMKWIFLFYF